MASTDIYVRKDVYEADQRALISEIKLMHNELLKKIDEKFEAVDKRFEAVDKRFDAVDKRFDAVDKRLDALEGRVSRLEGRVGKLEERVSGLEGRVGRLETKVEVLVTRVEGVEARIGDTNNFIMIGVAILSFLIVFVAFIRPISRLFRMWSKSTPKRISITREEVELIKEIITANFDVKARTKPLP